MIHVFNIFEVDKTGIPLWVETAKTLEAAKARVGEMLKLNPTVEYMIFSQHKQGTIFAKANTRLKPFK